MPFTKETAREAGRKSKRGKSRISLTMRQFLFEILQDNREKFQYLLDELSPRDFINTYMKLLPYILSMQHLQKFDVGELSKSETRDLIKDIVQKDKKV